MESCCIQVDAGESRLLREEHRVARRPHHCFECGLDVRPGEKYSFEVIVFEGELETFRICWTCWSIRRDFFPCGWIYGSLREDFWECNGWDYVEGPQPEDPAADPDERGGA